MTLDELLKRENFNILVINGNDPVDKKLHKKLAEKGYKTRKIKTKIKTVIKEVALGNYHLVLFNNRQITPENLVLHSASATISAQTKSKPDIALFGFEGEEGLEKLYEIIRLSHARRFYINSSKDLPEEIQKIDLEEVISTRMQWLINALFHDVQPIGVKSIAVDRGEYNIHKIEMCLVDVYKTVKRVYSQKPENEALAQLITCLEGTYSILFERNLETAAEEFYSLEKIAQRAKDTPKEPKDEFKPEDFMMSSKGIDKLVFASIGNLPIYNHVLFIIQQTQDTYIVYDVIIDEGKIDTKSRNIPYLDFMTQESYELNEGGLPGLIKKTKEEKYLSVIVVKDKEPNDLGKEQKLDLAFQAYLHVKMAVLKNMKGESTSP